MFGASRESLGALSASLDGMRGESSFRQLPADVRSVSALMAEQKALRLALSDSGRSSRTRIEIARQVLQGKISPLALQLVEDAVGHRWSDPDDLVTALATLADTSAFIAALDDGTLDAMEEDIFRFDRVLAESPRLQSTLTDPAIDAGTKAAIIRDLVSQRTQTATADMLVFALSHLRGQRASEVLQGLQALAANQRQKVVAEVRVARPLSPEVVNHIAERLSRTQGRDIRVNVIVDPAILGGVHVTLGGDVIDGTITTRLEQARRLVAR